MDAFREAIPCIEGIIQDTGETDCSQDDSTDKTSHGTSSPYRLFLCTTLIVNKCFDVFNLVDNNRDPSIHSVPNFGLEPIEPNFGIEEIQKEINAHHN